MGGGAERICQVSGFLEFAVYASRFITCVYLTPCRLFCFQPALPTLTAHATPCTRTRAMARKADAG
jgi:hypothetical protein